MITAELTAVDATSTRCVVNTDLSISGKVAQFGRGALADVSDKLLAQFVENLNQLIASGPAPSAPTPVEAPTPTATPPTSELRIIQSAEVAPLDLLGTAGAPILKRAIPVIVAAIAIVVIGVLVF
jgi:hypothetical protein